MGALKEKMVALKENNKGYSTGELSKDKIINYIALTKRAFEAAKKSKCLEAASCIDRNDFLGMIEAYIKDSEFFLKKSELVNAFSCIVYAHGWLDAGARIGLFDVHDNKLFVVE